MRGDQQSRGVAMGDGEACVRGRLRSEACGRVGGEESVVYAGLVLTRRGG